jgi:hypothetical protein
LNYNLNSILSSSEDKKNGYSIRCIKGNFDILIGSYPNTNDDYKGSTNGPYTTTISNINIINGYTCEIIVQNISNKGWNPIKFLLNLSDYSVTLTEQSGIGDAGIIGPTWAGRGLSVRRAATPGTFSLLEKKIILRFILGVTGTGWTQEIYEVVMQL